MKHLAILTAAALTLAAPAASAESTTGTARFAVEATIAEILTEFPGLTFEQFLVLNPAYADATPETIVPQRERFRFAQG